MRSIVMLLFIFMTGCGGIVSGNTHRAVVDQYKSDLRAAEKWANRLHEELRECTIAREPNPEAVRELNRFGAFLQNEWTPMLAKALSEEVEEEVQIFIQESAFFK